MSKKLSKTVSKSDLYNRIYAVVKCDPAFELTTKVDVDDCVNTIIAEIENAVIGGNDVVFRGFGRFHFKKHSRKVRNPKTGERLGICDEATPGFRPYDNMVRIL